MIVDPYKRNPEPPAVALLTRDGTIIDEHGELVEPDAWPDGLRAWCDYDTVRELVTAGVGEALCWNHEEIRWRHRRFEEGWRNRPSDVAVLRVPFPERPEAALRALASWRDWLARYGASPTGTTGSAAFSLLRATLDDVLFCSFGTVPPILQTLGGRVELGPAGGGRFEGELVQIDLQAAYAHELAGLRYGGRWYSSDELAAGGFTSSREPAWWHARGFPVFVHARVRVPAEGLYGPLVRRPRRRLTTMQLFFSQLYEERYPRGRVITGVWTWEEVAEALDAGCRLLELRELWVHHAARRPFERWWAAVLEGRSMPGLAGVLAKSTGNALWGRFCMDARAGGVRSIRSRNGKLSSRPVAINGGVPPAHDLAETVSGRVRAELHRVMRAAGEGLVSAHTDGAWLRRLPERWAELERGVWAASSWRVKQPARRLDVIDPQTLRYWPRPAAPFEPVVVYAGMPAGVAGDAFERRWAEVTG